MRFTLLAYVSAIWQHRCSLRANPTATFDMNAIISSIRFRLAGQIRYDYEMIQGDIGTLQLRWTRNVEGVIAVHQVGDGVSLRLPVLDA